MKKVIILFLLLFTAVGYSQNLTAIKVVPTGIGSVNPVWGNEIMVSSFRPIGPISGIRASNGDLYIAVNDTLSTNNAGGVLYKSTNNGVTWTLILTGTPQREKYENLKLVGTGPGPDSLYLFYQVGSSIYCWNFINSITIYPVGTVPYRSFDIIGSNAYNALYIFFDVLSSNSIPRSSSVDGGITWGNNANVTSSGALPKLTSVPGDTIFLNYYTVGTSGQLDTVSGPIRQARYRQTAAGTLSSVAFIDVVTDVIPKTEFITASLKGEAWFLYTVGTTGAIDIKGRKSITSGVSYDPAIDIAANPNVDEYWVDIKYFVSGTGGFDLVYYSDSLQGGSPTNNTDKLVYKYANIGASNFTGSTVSIAHHPPFWSSANFKPKLVQMLGTTDVGVIWVGLDGTAGKVYWDRYLLVTNVNPNNSVAEDYRLSQNYPNPFNPTTKIDFAIPKSGFVILKVFDILGREVATLISQNFEAGSYTVDMDGTKLTSGTYFYKLEVNGFTDVKRMTLIK